jgi:hypothetical protein
MKMFNLILILSAPLILFACNNGNEKKIIEASGTFESTNIIVSSRTAGNIQTMNFREGANVSAVVFMAPILQLILLGYVANMDVNVVHTTIYDQDKTGTSREYAGDSAIHHLSYSVEIFYNNSSRYRS